MEEQAKWYVVHTYSGYENKVAKDLETMVENRRLQNLIQDIKVPVEQEVEIKDGKERVVEHKLFPGYVLVKMVMTDESWYIVRNTRGCTGFVGPASKPVPLSDEEVAKLGVESGAEAEQLDAQSAGAVSLDYKVGDEVEITAGPLKGFPAMVEKLDMKARKVHVKVSMFGRETPAELELDQVKPL